MKRKICAIGIIAILALIPSTLSISAQHVISTNNSTNIEHNKCISNTLDSAIIGGDVLGLIFDVRAYVICDGVEVEFRIEEDVLEFVVSERFGEIEISLGLC